MKRNGVLYLDDFLAKNKENDDTEAHSQNSFKEIYEIEEYILRKQGETMSFAPEVFYKEEYFPSINSISREKTAVKKQSMRTRSRNGKYKPKNIRGTGVMREGLCEICNMWFRMKTSSYWYHMNFKHGIASNGDKYPEPLIKYRDGKAFSICNLCDCEVPLGLTSKSIKYNWYKHFQKDHASYYE